MNTDNNNMEERLWSFIDGSATASEKTVMDQLVKNDAAWKAKYGELMAVHELLQASELESPSMRFSKNVMEEIAKLHIAPASKKYLNNKIIWSIGFFFIAMVVGFLVYGFAQMGIGGTEEGTISKNLGRFDFSKFFSNSWVNALMMVNVVLGLFLLDNYLGNKRKEFRKEIQKP